jgi:hypothetical protein
MSFLIWYGLSSLLLGILLFFPVRNFILALNVNRHQRKVKRAITEQEHEALKKKVTVLAAAIAVTFAFLFNRVLLMQFVGR